MVCGRILKGGKKLCRVLRMADEPRYVASRKFRERVGTYASGDIVNFGYRHPIVVSSWRYVNVVVLPTDTRFSVSEHAFVHCGRAHHLYRRPPSFE